MKVEFACESDDLVSGHHVPISEHDFLDWIEREIKYLVLMR